MKLVLPVALSFALISTASLAGGSHSGGHGNAAHSSGHGHATGAAHHELSIGRPGQAADVTRNVKVVMRETDAGDMVFEPAGMQVKRGETVRLTIVNEGELEHELVIDDHHGIAEHKALMEKFPEMEHDDPNSVRLEPGQEGTIIWAFTNSGDFEYACLIPGHYQAGMRGTLEVLNSLAKN